jgi:hypothetical protein
MKRTTLAAIIAILATTPLSAQLLTISRIRAQDASIGKQPRYLVPDLLNFITTDLAQSRSSLTIEVRSYVTADVVRIEGFAPLLGFPDHLVLLRWTDGRSVWLDPVARTYFEWLNIGAVGLKALEVSSAVKTVDEKAADLLGRRATGTRTEITLKRPDDTGRAYGDPAALDYRRFEGGRPIDMSAATAAWLRTPSAISNDRKIVVRTWTTDTFGTEGLLAGQTGLTAAIDRLFGVKQNGLPLRQIVQATSSNGFGQKWEANVVSVSTHSRPPEDFQVPPGFVKVNLPGLPSWTR